MSVKFRAFALVGPMCLAGLCLSFAPLPTFGQECRKPTTQELQAVENAQRALKQAVDGPVIGLGWKLQSQKSDQIPLSVATDAKPKRPLMSCWPIYDAKFVLAETNPHYAALHSQAEKGSVAEQNWMAPCLKAMHPGCEVKPDDVKQGDRARAASGMEIRITENDPFMRLSHPEPIRKLDVQSAAVAYQSPSNDEYLVDTIVCVGAWKPDVVFAPGNRDVPFPFQHSPGTPFLENMCIKIVAAPEMAEEVLRKVNWQQLNDSLTK